MRVILGVFGIGCLFFLWETGWVALVVLALCALLNWALGLTATPAGVAVYSLVFAIPAILAAVAVNRLDPRDFEAVVSAAAPATRAAAPPASDPDSSGRAA